MSLGVVTDAVWGDRDRYGFIPHPVVLMGRLISALDHRFNSARRRYRLNGDYLFISEENRNLKQDQEAKNSEFRLGLLSLVIMILLMIGLGILIEFVLGGLGLILSVLLESLIIGILLSARSLYDRVRQVGDACRDGRLVLMQQTLQHIVSRDTKLLDKRGVVSGAFDSLCDNYVDGVVAPLFWWAIFGVPGLIVYKIVNVADSMIGYHSQPYLYYGKAAARGDDFLNFIPARLAAVNLLFASLFIGVKNFSQTLSLLKSGDWQAHRSPSAGWPEAAMAGALNIKIGGERIYPGGIKVEQWIGNGTKQINHEHINRGLQLYKYACIINLFNILIIYYLVVEGSEAIVWLWLKLI